jgi:hypothetical protein
MYIIYVMYIKNMYIMMQHIMNKLIDIIKNTVLFIQRDQPKQNEMKRFLT